MVDALDFCLPLVRQGARILLVCQDLRAADVLRARILTAYPMATEAPHRAIASFGLGSIQLVSDQMPPQPFDATDRLVVFMGGFVPSDQWVAFVGGRVGRDV